MSTTRRSCLTVPLSTLLALPLALAAAQPSAQDAVFTGSVTLDGEAASAGSSITAFVRGEECGNATVHSGPGGSRYTLVVAPSCGAEGATVRFRVSGRLALESGTWRAGARVTLDLTAWSHVSGEPDEPSEPDLGPHEPIEETADVELRVWQLIRDPLRLYLSARPAGGSWGHTERLAMDETNARETLRYEDRTVAVPLAAGGTAQVELRVWQRISDPLQVYLSARPVGGSWGETERLALGRTNARGTFRYSDRTVAVPLARRAAPTWEQIDALIDATATGWNAALDEIDASREAYLVLLDGGVEPPSAALAASITPARDVARAMVERLTALRHHPATADALAAAYLEASIASWQASVDVHETLRLFSLERVPRERAIEAFAVSDQADALLDQATCALWTAQDYDNAKEVCAPEEPDELAERGDAGGEDEPARTCLPEETAALVIAATVRLETSTGWGSAFYVGNDQFVTAAHVVDDAPARITLRNATISRSATVIGVTPFTGGDLALLKASGIGLTALRWAGALVPGATVYVVGYPLGPELDVTSASFTRGIVSRVFTTSDGITLIQTDAATNPGNSGGPIVDACGRVAAVVSAKIDEARSGRDAEGLAFGTAEPSLRQLLAAIRAGQYSRANQPQGPTWEQMDALYESAAGHWEQAVVDREALTARWNAIVNNERFPSSRLAAIARELNALSFDMWVLFRNIGPSRGSEGHPALANATVADWRLKAWRNWSAAGELDLKLVEYALDEASWGEVLSAYATGKAAFAAYKVSECALWRLLYPNPKVVCDQVAEAQRQADDAAEAARTYTEPTVTTPDTSANTAAYTEADVAALVHRHCRLNGTYNYDWLPTLTYGQGVWRVTWNQVDWDAPGTVTFTEATAQITVIDGCRNAR